MTAEVAKYTMEQVEALELAPGTEHEKLEGWVPELASDEDLRQALSDVQDARGVVRERQSQRDVIAARYSRKAPELGGFIETQARAQNALEQFRLRAGQRTLVEIVLNVVLSEVPTAVTAVMMTTAIKAAMRPYSMAVAP